MKKPEFIKHWDVTEFENFVSLSMSYVANIYLYSDGRMLFKTDPEGSGNHDASHWKKIIDEAFEVGRYYYGEEWGK